MNKLIEFEINWTNSGSLNAQKLLETDRWTDSTDRTNMNPVSQLGALKLHIKIALFISSSN